MYNCVSELAERNTEYVVYVAAVNGAGRGEWQQTQNAVTTQGLGEPAKTPPSHTLILRYVHTPTHWIPTKLSAEWITMEPLYRKNPP